MPKVRCAKCHKILNVPETAREKGIRCPNCQTTFRFSAAGTKISESRRRAAVAPEADDLISNLDLNNAEDQHNRICPKCAFKVDEGDVECSKCGVNLETGQVSKERQRKKTRKGPDPAEYYTTAWRDSWKFVMNNKHLVVITGTYWSLFALLCGGSIYFAFSCERIPPFIFWLALALLFAVGAKGWFWFLSIEIINATLDKKRVIKRVNFDFFSNIALGLKGIFWPFILWLPVVPVLTIVIATIAMAGSLVASNMGMAVGAIIAGCAWLLPMFVLPVALVHMTMTYTYKAFLPVDMLKVAFNNIGAVLYWWMMAFVVSLPFAIIAAVIGSFFAESIGMSISESVPPLTRWVLSLIGEDPLLENWIFNTISALIWTGIAVLIVAPICFLIAFPAVFLMRADGLLAFYFRRTLELVNEQGNDVPAGFWARYLACLVDILIVGLAATGVWGLYEGSNWFLKTIEFGEDASLLCTALSGIILIRIVLKAKEEPGGVPLAVVAVLMLPIAYFWPVIFLMILIPIVYYVRQEPEGGTLGKKALGLMVTNMDGKPISRNAAVARLFARVLSGIPFGFGFFMAGFTPTKQTLHDKMTNTLVVWQGDDLSY